MTTDGGAAPPTCASVVRGDEDVEVRVDGVRTTTLTLDGASSAAEIEELLVRDLVERHTTAIEAAQLR